MDGLWGNGQERRERLTESGYDYQAIQSIVNALVYDRDFPVENSVETVDNSKDDRLLTVEFDRSKYDGIEIVFTEG